MCPIFLSRHVLKFVLGRRIGWHDLAFFDPVMFKSLRELVKEAEEKNESTQMMFSALDLTFCVELDPEEVFEVQYFHILSNQRDLDDELIEK